jgi:hypothetical protein
MKNNVVNFPTQERKAENILQMLEAGVLELEEAYDRIDSLHEMINKAESEATVMETVYNENIKEYAKYVPVGEIPIRLVQYSSEANIKITADGEEINISFDWEKEEDE